jgi:hypothetical protein
MVFNIKGRIWVEDIRGEVVMEDREEIAKEVICA